MTRLYRAGGKRLFDLAMTPAALMVADAAIVANRADGVMLVADDTFIVVVSDHGVKPMHGGICVNEWLLRKGYLALAEEPGRDGLVPFSRVKVDWSKTQVWGSGSYYARIFMSAEGLEPQGTIPVDRYEAFRDELTEALRSISAPDGSDIGTRVFKPQQVYREVRNIPLAVLCAGPSWTPQRGASGHSFPARPADPSEAEFTTRV